MKVFFDDELFDAQLLRAMNHIYYGGADLGECLASAHRITQVSSSQWYEEWLRLADRIAASAETSLADGHSVSAREAFLRASNYYRTAYIFLIGSSLDTRLVHAFDRHVQSFRKAAALFSNPVDIVEIPYEGTTLPGYFFRAESRGSRSNRPTLIVTGGYDGTAEELYFFNAAAALRRGYNCLCFDGPGQGSALVHQGLVFRPDWEVVIGAAVDYLMGQPDVDGSRLALMGLSFGGYLAPRAASKERRLAACIADPGQYDIFGAMQDRFSRLNAKQPPEEGGISEKELDSKFSRMLQHPTKGWSLRRGMWTHGVDSPQQYIQLLKEYTLAGHAEHIQCPTLVCAAENDPIAAYAGSLFNALKCEKALMNFTNSEGAGEHCEDGNRSIFHQRVFDWLDKRL